MDVGIRSLVGLLVDCPHNWPRKGDQFIVTLVVGSWVLNIVELYLNTLDEEYQRDYFDSTRNIDRYP